MKRMLALALFALFATGCIVARGHGHGHGHYGGAAAGAAGAATRR